MFQVHVFHLHHETKESWIPVSAHPIPLAFFYSPDDECYRIIGIIQHMKVHIHYPIIRELNPRKARM